MIKIICISIFFQHKSTNLTTEQMFKEGDLVFAKCTREKPWPAKITKVLSNSMFKVDFYNHNSIGIINQIGLEYVNCRTVQFYTQLYFRKKPKDQQQVIQAIRCANLQYLRREQLRKIQSSKWPNGVPTKDQLQQLQKKLRMEFKRPVCKPINSSTKIKHKPSPVLKVKPQAQNQSGILKKQGSKENLKTLDHFIKTGSKIEQIKKSHQNEKKDGQNATRERALRRNFKYKEQLFQSQDIVKKRSPKQKKIKKKLKKSQIWKNDKVKRQTAPKIFSAEKKMLQNSEPQLCLEQKEEKNLDCGEQNRFEIVIEQEQTEKEVNVAKQIQNEGMNLSESYQHTSHLQQNKTSQVLEEALQQMFQEVESQKIIENSTLKMVSQQREYETSFKNNSPANQHTNQYKYGKMKQKVLPMQAQQVKAVDYTILPTFQNQEPFESRCELSQSQSSPQEQQGNLKDRQSYQPRIRSSQLQLQAQLRPHDTLQNQTIQPDQRQEENNHQKQNEEQTREAAQKMSNSDECQTEEQFSQTFENLTPSYPNPLFILINQKCAQFSDYQHKNDDLKQRVFVKQATQQCSQIAQQKTMLDRNNQSKQQEISQANSSFMLARINKLEAQEKEKETGQRDQRNQLLLQQGRYCQYFEKLYGDSSINNDDYVTMVQGLPQLKKEFLTADTRLMAACIVQYLQVLQKFVACQNEQKDMKTLQMWQRQLFLGILDGDVLSLKTLIQYQIMLKMMSFLSAFQKNRTPRRALCHVEYLFVNSRLGVYLTQFTPKRTNELPTGLRSSYRTLVVEFNQRALF